MSRQTPQATRDEFFIVSFGVLLTPPGGFLPISDNFEQEGGGKESKRDKVAGPESWVEI